ncbi:hypothetical protein LEN26_000107 [Aphanomyces euteiches]|nr:hypothetical protein AeMF1_000022 [Aphanomyces euteiches]KAH9164302.1 hypothetical protein LEN26_000107 [Aphanomyces euteiches]
MVRGKSENESGNDLPKTSKGKGKTKDKADTSKPGSTNVAKRLTAELHRLRGTSNGELEESETAALGREFTSESNLEHPDPHVRLLVASCVAELLRVTAPETPFGSEHELYEVFLLIVRVLRETTKDTDITWFGLLETLATVKMFNLAVGLEPESGDISGDLVVNLFRCLFDRIQDDHSAKVEANMVSIMTGCLEEYDSVSPALLETVLEPLLHGDEHPRAYHMAQQVIRKSSDHLQNALSLFFNSVLVDAIGNHHESELKEHALALIYESHKIQPGLLLYVLPNVCLQLQVDEMEIRSNAIALMGRLFASSHADYGAQYMKNFREFLGRFRDVKKEIRLQMVQVCSIIAQRKPDLAVLIDAELQLRLQDQEWEVRRAVVNEICDLAAHSLSIVSQTCLREVGERMKDKKVVIRKEAMTGLAQVYAAHVSTSWTNGNMEISTAAKELAWIPDYVLKCFAYREQELRLRVVQLLDDILLPKQTTDVYRMKGLLFIWRHLDAGSKEALKRILMERMQCRKIITRFIEVKNQLRGKSQANLLTSAKQSLKELGSLLPETEGIAGLVEKLVTWKDMKLVKHLDILCSAGSQTNAIRQAREDLIKMVGSKTPLGEFMKNICRKLAMTTVNSSSLTCLLSMLEDENNKSCSEILQMVGSVCPHLLASHLESLEQLLSLSPKSSCVFDLFVSLTKHSTNLDEIPTSMKKILINHCTSGSVDVVKKSARILVKLFPNEVTSFVKKLLKQAEFSEAKLQALAIFVKHAPEAISDAPTLFKQTLEVYENAAKKRDVKCLVLNLLTNLVLHKDLHDSSRHVLDLCFQHFQGTNYKTIAPLRATAASSVLKMTRVPAIENQIEIEEWHSLGYVIEDPEDIVRRAMLKKLTANLLHHPINHKYMCYLALACTDPNADMKKEVKTLLQTAVQRMRRMYEARVDQSNTASSLMVPEYTLPYMIHLVLHSPWDEVSMNSLYFLLEALVSHAASEADNISFLLQMLHKLSLCHDATDPSAAKMYEIIDSCTTWLKKRIKNQINLKAYPGQIYLPKQLFQPGRKDETKSSTANEISTMPETPKQKKRPAPIKVSESDKASKKVKKSPTPTKVTPPSRRMPSRLAKNDANLADQDSDVEELQEELPMQTYKEQSSRELITVDDDEESTNENLGEHSDGDESKANDDKEDKILSKANEETKSDENETNENDEKTSARVKKAKKKHSAKATADEADTISDEEETKEDGANINNGDKPETARLRKSPRSQKIPLTSVSKRSQTNEAVKPPAKDQQEPEDEPTKKSATADIDTSKKGKKRVYLSDSPAVNKKTRYSTRRTPDKANEPEGNANEEEEEMTSFRSRRRR